MTGRPGKPRPEQDQIGGRRLNGCSPSPRVSVARGVGQPASETDGHRPARDTEPGLQSALGPQPDLNSKIRVHFGPRDTEGFAYQYAISTHPLVGLSSGDGALAAIRSPGNRMLTRSHVRHSVSRILSRMRRPLISATATARVISGPAHNKRPAARSVSRQGGLLLDVGARVGTVRPWGSYPGPRLSDQRFLI